MMSACEADETMIRDRENWRERIRVAEFEWDQGKNKEKKKMILVPKTR